MYTNMSGQLLVVNTLFCTRFFSLPPHCLKFTQNVAFDFFKFWHFQPIFVLLKLTCLVTLFDRKRHLFKIPFLVSLINFCPLKM